MIAKIYKGNFFKGLIKYNESKVQEGMAYLLENQTYGNNPAAYNKVFMETCALNSKVYKNKAIHISISLAVGEIIEDEKFKEIARSYLDKMGYENSPYLIYKHIDTANSHIHIVTSSVDWEGKKVDDYRDHKRSEKLSREIEKEFKLLLTESKGKESVQLAELNANKYKFFNAMSKASQRGDLKELLISKIGEEAVKELLLAPRPNKDVKAAFDQKDSFAFGQVMLVLENQGLVYKSKKDLLKEKALYFQALATSKEDYFEKLGQNGVYVRELQQGKTRYLKYGFKDESFYLRDKFLPKALQYEQMQFIGKDRNLYKSKDEQKAYLKRIVSRTVMKSISLDDLQTRLELNKVEMIRAENSGGVYGLSFRSLGVENPEIFKGSELDKSLGFKNLNANLNINQEKVSGFKVSISKEVLDKGNSTHHNVPHLGKLSRALSDTSKDEFEREQERKKNKENEL